MNGRGEGPPTGPPIIVLTDYGRADEFVGIVHLVLGRLAPGVAVVDLTHDIAAHDVRAGAITLWRTVPWLAPGVVLAVVDPGVATGRRAVAIETAAEAGLWLVGPDNGLLLPAALAAGGITRAVALAGAADRPARDGSPPPATTPAPAGPVAPTPGGLAPPTVGGWGGTFAGRDIFAPAAARLSLGVDLGALGPAIDPATLEGRPVDDPVPTAEGVTCEVLWVDRFGNVQLNARPADLDHLGPDLTATLPGVRTSTGASRTWMLVRVAAYADLAPGAWGLVTDSYGLCAICGDQRSAAGVLGMQPGDPVLIRARSSWL
jgi:S-adenosylmethionine hydrolase